MLAQEKWITLKLFVAGGNPHWWKQGRPLFPRETEVVSIAMHKQERERGW